MHDRRQRASFHAAGFEYWLLLFFFVSWSITAHKQEGGRYVYVVMPGGWVSWNEQADKGRENKQQNTRAIIIPASLVSVPPYETLKDIKYRR
ncbi:hypothetical protein B0T09DRAFT_123300 [Sordaria sp. MPI-SDFR-AT-0083]|nr:hypothetical protein B0T09DRAFT_123300 [Sordaria sp. MPI-SDFR-AT-0083]